MPLLNAQKVRITSRGFSLLRDKEKREEKRIPIETVVRETGLARMTVRRFLSPDQGGVEVGGSPIAAAASIAQFLGVGLGDLLEVEEAEGENNV